MQWRCSALIALIQKPISATLAAFDSNGEISITIDGAHLRALSLEIFPIQGILDDTKCIYPQKSYIKVSCDLYRILDGFRQLWE